MAETHANRTIIRITGTDREEFLQGLVTCNVKGMAGLSYGALLTPQGKYLADFFLLPEADAILLDIDSSLADTLLAKLKMYKLRANVAVENTGLCAIRGLGVVPEGAHPDPRHPALGWRKYQAEPGGAPGVDWDAIRVAHCIPETDVELIPDDSFILEAGFERLHGVDFRKGCYVGQEVTARMKHKTELRKGLVRVRVDGTAPVGTVIEAGGKPAGVLYTQSGGMGIAYLRFDRAEGEMRAGTAILHRA